MRVDLSWLGWQNWSLIARLMVGSGAALVISATILVYTSLHTEVEATRKTLQDRLSDEVDFLLPSITEQAVIGDYANIERLLNVRVKREEIENFSWTDEQGNIIKARGGSPTPKEAPDWFIAWVSIQPLVHTHEVNIGGVPYGKVSFELTPQPAINRLWAGLLDKLQIFILGVGVFFAVIIQILTSGLKPLYRLATGAQKFGQGDYSVRLPREGVPEMMESIKAFNSMADSIERLVTSLRESEARKRLLATIVEQSDQAIFTEDLDALITSWNAGAAELFGYGAEEVLGRDYGILLPSEDREKQGTLERIRSGQKLSYETRMVAKNGTIIDIEVSAAPMFDDYGIHAGEITIARDITERKRTQEQLLQAKQAAEDASRAKSDFVANMSHEIRTPMNGILGFTELVLDSDLSPEQRDNLNTVKSSAESLLGVINDILDFSKIEAGKLDIERIPFSLRADLGQTMKPLELRARQKGLSLTWSVAPNVPDGVVGDPVRLRQVIVNLVGNAIKFTDHGEVSLAAEMEFHREGEARLVFSVRDTGIGISLEKQRVIFEAFSQADMSTTRLYGGTGLGLTIASRLVELMGGRISVESTPAEGSVFRFSIQVGLHQDRAPLSPTAGVPAAPPSPLRSMTKAKPDSLSILVAEDNPVNQKLAVRLLEKLGHQVHLVENGEQAVDAVKARNFDLVLLDVQMPVMGGLAACGAIRAWEKGPGTHVPIVAMTAHAMQGDRERCLDAGMDGYIPKPIDIAALVSMLEALRPAAKKRVAVPDPAPAPIAGNSGMDLDLALHRLENDHGLLCDIIGIFLSEYPKSLAQIEAALQAGDSEKIYVLAHRFKGSVSSFAAQRATSLGAALESAGREGNVAEARRLFLQLKEETSRLLPQLSEIFDSLRRDRVGT